LWNDDHASEEFNLVLGDGNDSVSVNALVYYKIYEDKERLLDYAYRSQNPVEALDAYAHRALMEETRSSSLEDVLSRNRAEFAGRLRESLRNYSAENRLGIDVVDVALVVIHPPIEAAEDYLDVISAKIDANRYKIVAEGDGLVEIASAQSQSNTEVAAAEEFAAKSVGKAYQDSEEFLAVGKAYEVAPETLKQRLWYETNEEALMGKRLIVVDSSLAGADGEVLIDLRTQTNGKKQELVPSGVFPTGAR
jgi:membrane protease subunit HflK